MLKQNKEESNIRNNKPNNKRADYQICNTAPASYRKAKRLRLVQFTKNDPMAAAALQCQAPSSATPQRSRPQSYKVPQAHNHFFFHTDPTRKHLHSSKTLLTVHNLTKGEAVRFRRMMEILFGTPPLFNSSSRFIRPIDRRRNTGLSPKISP